MSGTMLDAAHHLVGGWVLGSRVACACPASLGRSARCSTVPAGALMRGANRRALRIGQMSASGGAFLACVLKFHDLGTQCAERV